MDQQLERGTAAGSSGSLLVKAEEARARVEALKQVWGLKVVKNEDDDERTTSKRIKSESL